MTPFHDSIAAIATAPGRGGIGIVRVSGPALAPLVLGMIGKPLPPRRAVYREFLDENGGVLDVGIAVFFPAPHSYTGEDVVEFQGHGGPAVLRALLERCLTLGARPAEPGEFTRRAYLNNRMDLAQAEGVIDLINAQTAAAARGALRTLIGEFSEKIQELVTDIVAMRAFLEAGLDFPEEDVASSDDSAARLHKAIQDIDALFAASRLGPMLREGVRVVLAGPPNVGKSSLLNRLAGEDAAIVTDLPGTTRDAISRVLDWQGMPVQVTDTAGLRATEDPVESLGVMRARQEITRADMVVFVTDGEHATVPAESADNSDATAHITVINKIDLSGHAPGVEVRGGNTLVWLSAKTGEGVDLLRAAVLTAVGWHGEETSGYLARARHLTALRAARAHLLAATQNRARPEICAEDLRLAQQALAAITGVVTADDILGEIFSRFCIGK